MVAHTGVKLRQRGRRKAFGCHFGWVVESGRRERFRKKDQYPADFYDGSFVV